MTHLQGQCRLKLANFRHGNISVQDTATYLDEQVCEMWQTGYKTLALLLWFKYAGRGAPETSHRGKSPPGLAVGRPSFGIVATTPFIKRTQ